MSNLIKLLPDHVANQIAAGEVIQRPASVIKELLENSVDAGSTQIKVIIKDAGRSLIVVSDNGCGMSATDARMSFERHATSKIKSADDLFNLHTKGFRGEALASIASVAQVELKTRLHDETLGTRLVIEGSEEKLQEPAQTAAGTQFFIKNLFFNIPARRHFLKSDAVELKHIIEEFFRVALAHPEVAFTLVNNEQEVFVLRSGNLKQRIVSAFGQAYNEKIVPVQQESPVLKIEGYVGKPEFSRKTRGDQYLFVNQRFIKSQYLNHAIATCYDNLIEKGAFPCYFIYLTVDPKILDINIHPTKTEVKFTDEKTIYVLLQAAVRQSIGMFNIKPTLDFDSLTQIEFSPLPTNIGREPQDFKSNTYNPANYRNSNNETKSSKGWEDFLKIQQEFNAPLQREVELVELQNAAIETVSLPVQQEIAIEEQNAFIQVQGKYILTAVKSGVLLIDQQRAHERILFDTFLEQLKSGTPQVQTAMFPEQVTLSPADFVLAQELIPHFHQVGFLVEVFGVNTLSVNGLPAALPAVQASVFIEQIIENIKHQRTDSATDIFYKLAVAMAKAGGIKRGKKLLQTEMSHLVQELFSSSNPNITPNGKPVIITFAHHEIEKKFN